MAVLSSIVYFYDKSLATFRVIFYILLGKFVEIVVYYI
jgi:hypothetical protein